MNDINPDVRSYVNSPVAQMLREQGMSAFDAMRAAYMFRLNPDQSLDSIVSYCAERMSVHA